MSLPVRPSLDHQDSSPTNLQLSSPPPADGQLPTSSSNSPKSPCIEDLSLSSSQAIPLDVRHTNLNTSPTSLDRHIEMSPSPSTNAANPPSPTSKKRRTPSMDIENATQESVPESPPKKRKSLSAEVDDATQEQVPESTPKKRKSTARKPAAPAPPPAASNRPKRERKAPERLGAEPIQQPGKKTKKTKTSDASAPKKPSSRVFDPVYATTNAQSRLGKADVYHMLLDSSAWSCLTASQQTTLLSLMPADSGAKPLLRELEAGHKSDVRPKELAMNATVFRTDVAKFKEELCNGHLSKTWLAGAEQCVKERMTGSYDKWKEEEEERWWGQKG